MRDRASRPGLTPVTLTVAWAPRAEQGLETGDSQCTPPPRETRAGTQGFRGTWQNKQLHGRPKPTRIRSPQCQRGTELKAEKQQGGSLGPSPHPGHWPPPEPACVPRCRPPLLAYQAGPQFPGCTVARPPSDCQFLGRQEAEPGFQLGPSTVRMARRAVQGQTMLVAPCLAQS